MEPTFGRTSYFSVSESINVPLFPLSILPLPGERVPLHVFEQKYCDLLEDLETDDLIFGILYADRFNDQQIGGLVKLEKVVNRYPTGESDIIVSCVGSFQLLRFFEHYEGRLYAGGEIVELELEENERFDELLMSDYRAYLKLIGAEIPRTIRLFDIAISLNLPAEDKLEYLLLSDLERKQKFLSVRLKLQKFVVEQEHKQKDSYKWN